MAVERLVDNIVEELGLVGVDVAARVGNHLPLIPNLNTGVKVIAMLEDRGEH